jgi:hypothetical protein
MTDALTRHELLRHDLEAERPFANYIDQQSVEERVRREVEAIAWALPEKREGRRG